MSWFNNNDKEEVKENDWYNKRSHQDSYFIDVSDRRNNLQYCRFCDTYTTFHYDRCSHCNNN